MKHSEIFFGIPFTTGSREYIRTVVADILKEKNSKQQYTIMTPNAEMLVAAQSDRAFEFALQSASINLCDGSGPAYIARICEKKKLARITGTDFLLDVLELGAKQNKKIYLLGSRSQSIVETAAAAFRALYPTTHIVGSDASIQFDIATTNGASTLVYDEAEMEVLQKNILTAAPDILIVAFGHPKQELFIHNFLKQFPSVQLAMGVGGAIDFYGGAQKRAPKWMQRIGIESVWRLLQEPKRWRRVATALIIFPLKYIYTYVRK